MDKLWIQDLEVYANHGVFPEEKKLGQKFLVSACIHLDTRKSGMTDDIEYSIDYGDLCHFICNYMQRNTFHLIEAAAEATAEKILKQYEQIREITITIKKPWAPIGLPIENVGVEITRGWRTAYLSIGSNMGDRENYLNIAVDRISESQECRVKEVSRYIETKPVGMVEQADFLNGCMKIETLLSPEELLTLIKEIELAAGRTREVHWGPRTLDIDILMYEQEIMWEEDLKIPHPYMDVRGFVLEPLAQIAPYAVHAISGQTVASLWKKWQEQNQE